MTNLGSATRNLHEYILELPTAGYSTSFWYRKESSCEKKYKPIQNNDFRFSHTTQWIHSHKQFLYRLYSFESVINTTYFLKCCNLDLTSPG